MVYLSIIIFLVLNWTSCKFTYKVEFVEVTVINNTVESIKVTTGFLNNVEELNFNTTKKIKIAPNVVVFAKGKLTNSLYSINIFNDTNQKWIIPESK